MKRNRSYTIVNMLVILLAMLACALPGQTIQPEPGIGPITIESAVAGTAQAASQQTEQANPVSTSTIVSTDIPTSTPKISVSGTSLIMREDQSTLFTDYKAGIQLAIPAGWLALRLGEDEYLKAYSSDVVLQNQAIQDRLAIIRDLDTDHFRLEAIDVRSGTTEVGLTVIDVDFESGDVRSLEEWEKAERNRSHPFAKFKFLSAKYPQINNGTRVLVIEQSWAYDQVRTQYYRGVFFSLPSGTMVLDFFVDAEQKDAILPEFDQVVNSVTPLSP